MQELLSEYGLRSLLTRRKNENCSKWAIGVVMARVFGSCRNIHFFASLISFSTHALTEIPALNARHSASSLTCSVVRTWMRSVRAGRWCFFFVTITFSNFRIMRCLNCTPIWRRMYAYFKLTKDWKQANTLGSIACFPGACKSQTSMSLRDTFALQLDRPSTDPCSLLWLFRLQSIQIY